MSTNNVVAWMLECQTYSGTRWFLSWSRSGAGVCNRLQGSEHEKPLCIASPENWMPTETAPKDTWILVDDAGFVEIAKLNSKGRWFGRDNEEYFSVFGWLPLPKAVGKK